MKQSLGKLLYGALFAIVVPGLMILWTARTAPAVRLPAIHSVSCGIGTALIGLLLLLLGMAALWRIGGGLPMNAFPPPRYVSTGIYRLVSHPIYVGFVFICAGLAIATGSASGLWLTTPVVAMASAALVLGYELQDMRKRFGETVVRNRLLPADQTTPHRTWTVSVAF